ncbi:hypothetical protein DI392_15695 [Vibrio albus]|uniref:Sel1 repeat family protein n=1 Tax=Vibrio albus TaxID=2200953 RepID=A0A2U3B6U9_9VIBR|nr:hypothetical protein [Vibrio albus]PWI32492.1 hypothetical protein DI392_15695 [Vibrio albus]
MKRQAINIFVLFSITLMTALPVNANPTPEMIQLYYQAADGDESKTEAAYDTLTALIEQEGARPLTLVYQGSAETLLGRDAWMPWNKMKYVEQGLAKIEKGLNLISTDSLPLPEQERVLGLPEYQLSRAMAATTYTQLPDMFNHFDPGYDLYLQLLEEPEFLQQPFAASAWVYRYAIEAAVKAEDRQQAQKWLTLMEEKQRNNPETVAARQFISEN